MSTTTNSQGSWNDNFQTDKSLNSSLFNISWGNSSEYSFSGSGVTLTSNGNSSGLMTSDQGASKGNGYGTYQATFSMPSGQTGAYVCLWPSTNAWPGPEIDLAEQSNGKVYLTVHWKGANDSNDYKSFVYNANLSHQTTVSVDWQANSLTFDVNGAQVVQYKSGGSIPIPKDHADGGENEAFGVGNVGKSGTSVTVSDMSYTASNGSASTPPPVSTTPVLPTASTHISVSSPAMQFVAHPSAGANASVTFSDPGLKDVYAFVMNSHNVAESNWIEVALNSSGKGTHDFHFANSGDYVVAVNNPTAQIDKGFSAHIAIFPTS